MFQRRMIFSNDSHLELATRIHDGEERVMLSIVGRKNNEEITASSVVLSNEDLALLARHFQDALNREVNWPPHEEK